MAWVNLAKVLDKKGWSMRRFAEELELQPKVVSRYFKQGYDPNTSTLFKWCRALKCGLKDLIDPSLDETKKLMPRPKSAIEQDQKQISVPKIRKKKKH